MSNGTIARTGANPYPFNSDLWRAHNKQEETARNNVGKLDRTPLTAAQLDKFRPQAQPCITPDTHIGNQLANMGVPVNASRLLAAKFAQLEDQFSTLEAAYRLALPVVTGDIVQLKAQNNALERKVAALKHITPPHLVKIEKRG